MLSFVTTQTPCSLIACLAAVAILGLSTAESMPEAAAPLRADGAWQPDQLTPSLPSERRSVTDSIATYGGLTRAMVVTGEVLYMAQGLRIETADLADAEQPRFQATMAFTETVAALSLAQGHLLAAVGNRMVILDLSNPLQPRPVAEIGLSGIGAQLKPDARGTRVYASNSRPGGIDVIDLALPLAPRLSSHIDLNAADLAVGEGVLYVVAGYRFHVFDTRDLAMPVAVRSPWDERPWSFSRMARVDDHLYAVSMEARGGKVVHQLATFDLKEPLQPQLLGSTPIDPYAVSDLLGYRGRLFGALKHSHDPVSSLVAWGGTIGRNDLGWAGKTPFYGSLTALAAYGDHVYGATNGCGIKVFRWSAKPQLDEALAELPVAVTVPIAGSIGRVVVQGNEALVIGDSGNSCNRMDRVDFSSPRQPRRLAITPLRGPPGEVLYTPDAVAMAVSMWFGGGPALHLWPRSAAVDSPPLVVTGSFGARHLVFDQSRRLIMAAANRPSGQHPSETDLGAVTPSGQIARVTRIADLDQVEAIGAQAGRLAVVGKGPTDRWISLRLYEETGQRLLGHIRVGAITDQLYGLLFAGPALYVAGADLQVFDVSDGDAPRLVQRVAITPTYAVSIDVSGRLLAVAGREVLLFDATDRLAVRPLTRWQIDGEIADVAVLSRFVLVAAGDLGLLVLPVPEADWPAEDKLFVPAVAAPD